MNAPQTALHGWAAGEAGRPANPDWTIPQRWESYTPKEHATWATLYRRQMALLPGRACEAFIDGMRRLPIEADRIPNFEQLSEVLMRSTGWQVVAVPGLVPDEVFFDHLAHRRFPAGQFIRRADQLDYLQEPDVFHDVFGHVPMLMHPVMADFIQAYGVGGLRAQRLGALEMLARVYWYTVEFGLVREQGALRIFGAGIVSSAAESVFCLASSSPHRIGFDLPRVMRTRYRIDDFQQTYFVLDRLDDLLRLAEIDFAPLYQQVAALPALAPDAVLPDDAIITRGDSHHHRARPPQPA
ncbi:MULTISPECIES: phenylalanine 4-monooxygenase [Tepidimonas]|uniref:Phenylalanine-4-hydroxylase n=1 Tax=Tepidimonas aquatica TaxID=247482 RepID=A0A554WHH4_9BURK|nr:phenylalanine 4-monooxygenase [Tepidimonas aquatica]TSE23024.1 Phenylalanine-4-hydroxylase [Tepidimonas aquatica]